MKKVKFSTLGCKVNQYETEAMAELFVKNGYEITEDYNCDVFVLNTCTVTNLSDRKSRQQISKIRSENSDAIIAVVGCYSQVSPDEIENIEGVNVILGTKYRKEIVELCELAKSSNKIINKVENIGKNREFEELTINTEHSMTRAYIKIQEGCSQFCSYCIIPYARGPIRSRNIRDIVLEAKRLADNGFKEIVLTGIHVASYGKDLENDDIGLIDVIEDIGQIDKIKRIRLSSLEPRIVDKQFLDRLSKVEQFCDHFHLSLQSGSDSILQSMNRKYDTDLYEKTINLIREYYPYAAITTDIIVGFPGETDEDFEKTLNFVDKIQFSKIHVFKYSNRKGTVASKMKNQVSGVVKKERSKLLIEKSKYYTDKFLDNMLNQPIKVLFESKNDDGYIKGYTTNYIRVKREYNPNLSNKIIDVICNRRENEELVCE
ncbi:MAG: tRNA (N(6)-L-threonylcarbamoyladenosine(37)-C(2))-methylthiotransferase MtaB [Finegoldia magna]|uniref:tRNA (N(6)-L-threonylcarbamoyladenosine(37)-C(2))- methylthiotransferase MtaB n=1 Tax=Finegoldia magna TaxID=1260 RepID=UPI00242D9671|nr:tRNA (N(6)-L-threonylcarbamoyladenosine(37)-C(2))-methylthiotransferase MtaB [Finegoldia magna]MBS5941826.1 tRNA (N(6)-L-threonylcarbamoyladenosine(37)-C(2))-methylthiotransferase MtaB [Finegoldia magna]MBS5971074.1 tRNA (N(6)-L-threonylcarbamoyladenosine(37)-C(2))-methylthiotransferase MtaB [Finegoldia magna]MDU1399154.1 tRNA (N(6)-L-threonylcarbamoyladenosine(37)-C(2))-methylthiotransferase MtaB [Finegoldia magna]MDU2898265.1 tRNA (N(6)-L-threonylcarbamoyladenosine(37)-C(2))-methylthiotran